LNNKIKEYREKYNLTQEKFAEALGVSRQTIISLESGRYIASLQLALRIAQYFKVSVESIFCLHNEE
jgi:putative transcriptional regulator